MAAINSPERRWKVSFNRREKEFFTFLVLVNFNGKRGRMVASSPINRFDHFPSVYLLISWSVQRTMPKRRYMMVEISAERDLFDDRLLLFLILLLHYEDHQNHKWKLSCHVIKSFFQIHPFHWMLHKMPPSSPAVDRKSISPYSSIHREYLVEVDEEEWLNSLCERDNEEILGAKWSLKEKVEEAPSVSHLVESPPFEGPPHSLTNSYDN